MIYIYIYFSFFSKKQVGKMRPKWATRKLFAFVFLLLLQQIFFYVLQLPNRKQYGLQCGLQHCTYCTAYCMYCTAYTLRREAEAENFSASVRSLLLPACEFIFAKFFDSCFSFFDSFFSFFDSPRAFVTHNTLQYFVFFFILFPLKNLAIRKQMNRMAGFCLKVN